MKKCLLLFLLSYATANADLTKPTEDAALPWDTGEKPSAVSRVKSQLGVETNRYGKDGLPLRTSVAEVLPTDSPGESQPVENGTLEGAARLDPNLADSSANKGPPAIDSPGNAGPWILVGLATVGALWLFVRRSPSRPSG